MKKYGLKYLIFLSPFLAAVLIELFVLPMDFFTFRIWETLVVRRSYEILKGPFYPNMTIRKTEEGGDLKPAAACAIQKKDVVWQTDAYGYRKTASPAVHYPIIMVGDSNTAGGGLSQSEMISDVLEKRLNKAVYPLAPESIKYIFKHGLLKQTRPDVVILENIERGILTGNFTIPRNADFGTLSVADQMIWSVRLNPVVQSLAIYMDRTFKANMLQFVRARINAGPPTKAVIQTECPILFLQGPKANRDVPDNVRHEAALKIRHLSDFFTGRGIRFIFLPIPNKENIYYREVGTPKPVFLEKLISDLQAMGVEVADTQKAFENITGRTGTHLYHRDDTHWNALGVEVAATLVEDILSRPAPAWPKE